MKLKRIVTLAGVAVCALAFSACGSSGNLRYADNLGPGYVKVGGLYYQVQLSRALNRFSDEDSGYLQGLTKSQAVLPVADEWFGVFMQAYNKGSQTLTPATDYYITDTLNSRYTPLVNPDPNAFTYQAMAISPGGQLPNQDSLAWFGPTQGELLLFKIPYATLGDRPLTLHIVDPSDPAVQAQIELDL